MTWCVCTVVEDVYRDLKKLHIYLWTLKVIGCGGRETLPTYVCPGCGLGLKFSSKAFWLRTREVYVSKFVFEGASVRYLRPKHSETPVPATDPTSHQFARTLRLGEPPSTHPIEHPCTLRCTSDPSGILQPFFFEVCRDFDGLRRRAQNGISESHSCFLVGFIA